MSTTPKSNLIAVLGWTMLIVLTELLAFYFIQKSVDEQSGLNIKVIISCIIFGVVVTYSFYRILLGGTNIPLANLYWIMFSQVGALIIAYVFFSQKIYIKDWIAMVLFFVYLIITFYSKPE